MRRVIVLGSTGSIGTQALDVIRANPRRFELVGVAAGSNAELVAQQAEEFHLEHTALGAEQAEQLVRDVEADVVLNAITGSIGLGSTLAALNSNSSLPPETLRVATRSCLTYGIQRKRRFRTYRSFARNAQRRVRTPAIPTA